jgi:hypothetical protein
MVLLPGNGAGSSKNGLYPTGREIFQPPLKKGGKP